jgi:hypothetical protein
MLQSYRNICPVLSPAPDPLLGDYAAALQAYLVKLADVHAGRLVNVKEFGATGDGVTDDSDAIIAAVNAIQPTGGGIQGTQWGSYDWFRVSNDDPQAVGGVVHFPRGVYRTTKPIPVRGFVTYQGEGDYCTLIRFEQTDNTKAALQVEGDAGGYCTQAKIRGLRVWSKVGYGLKLTGVVLTTHLSNLQISSKNWGIYGGDTDAYLQGCTLDHVEFPQMGSGGVWLAGNLNHVHRVSYGGSGVRAGFDDSIPAAYVIKGGGWNLDHMHVEAGHPMIGLALGGPGPTFPGYATSRCRVSNFWNENAPNATTQRAWSLVDCNSIQIDQFSNIGGGRLHLKNCSDVRVDLLNNRDSVEFDATDARTVLKVGKFRSDWGLATDPGEARIHVETLGDWYNNDIENQPTGRFGNVLNTQLALDQRGGDCVLTHESVSGIGWCFKLNWTTAPNGCVDLYLACTPPAGVVSPAYNLFVSFILDWATWTPDNGGNKIVRTFNSMGGTNTETNFSDKGPCLYRVMRPTNLAGNQLLRFFGNAGTLYVKDLNMTLGGSYQAPPPPANFIRYASGQTVSFGSAAPTSGWWVSGSVVHNASPAAGQPIEWRCTASGNPGTWRAGPNLP